MRESSYAGNMSKNNKTLLLLDGNAIIHRAYHALPPLTTKSGKVVNAVYGFSATLLSVIEKFKPEYVVASFDLREPTFRHKEYKEYKAKRVKAPDELYEQIPLVKEVVKSFGIPIYEKEGFEADDMIGSLAKLASRDGYDVVIVTGDMDTLQLVDDHIKVFTMRRGIKDTVLYDEQGVREKYGFDPEFLPDYKGLAGDASDNIPGVSGVGAKTASDLLGKYQTLENVYEHLDELKGALREKLERDKMQAFQSKDLGTIRTNVVEEFEGEKCRFVFDEKTREEVRKIFVDLDFFSLLKRLSPSKKEKISQNKSLKGVREKKYRKILSKKDHHFFDSEKESPVAYVLDGDVDKFSGVVINRQAGRSLYVAWNGENKQYLREFFQDAERKKIGLHTKEEYIFLRKKEINFYEKSFVDVSLCAYVLGNTGDISLEHLVLSEFGEEVDFSSSQETLFSQESSEKLSPREEKLCEKADALRKVYFVLNSRIIQESKRDDKHKTLEDLLEKIEYPLVGVLARMEENGILFDKNVFEGISETLEKDIKKLQQYIYDLAGEEFNINSTKQLKSILFDKLQIDTKDIKKTKTGYSTASSELQKLKKQYPIAKAVEEYRELFKLKTTYVDTLPKIVAQDGRIHTTFNQTITATGRLSSTDPNLQNIPIKTDLGRLLRTAFIAKENHVLVSLDYSQIDLRCAAHVSGDKKMIEAFHRGDDIHTATACEIFETTPSKVTKLQRRQAKVLNFGVLYGMGVYGFMNASGVSRAEAQAFIDAYMERFSGLAEYLKSMKEFAKKHGYVETEWGRRRYIPEINSANFQVASAGERMAINLPVQGLAADIMKLAMIEADRYIREKGYKNALLLQVHDEIICEIPEKEEQQFSQNLREIMEQVYSLKVPLVVDVASGRSWGEL
jgi:DNA polymerase-1